MLEYCVSKQRNVISMGLSKQKSRPIDSCKKLTRKQVLLLKYCRNSAMLFQWVCQNRNPVLLVATKSNTYQEASIIEILCVETAQCYFNGFVKTGIQYS